MQPYNCEKTCKFAPEYRDPMTTQKPISKSPISDAFLSKNAEGNYLSNSCFCARCENITGFTFTGKEKDPETGYSYFGARYLEHELMSMWLSVDPMADKYPSISPYAYCAWNPVKLVDPNGREVYLVGEQSNQVVERLQTDKMKVTIDTKTGKLSVDIGEYKKCQLSKDERKIYKAITSTKISIHIRADKSEKSVDNNNNPCDAFRWNGKKYGTSGGSFLGATYDGNRHATTEGFIDVDLLDANGHNQGVPHEVSEQYFAGKWAIRHKKDIPLKKVGYYNRGYNYAHRHAIPSWVSDEHYYLFKITIIFKAKSVFKFTSKNL